MAVINERAIAEGDNTIDRRRLAYDGLISLSRLTAAMADGEHRPVKRPLIDAGYVQDAKITTERALRARSAHAGCPP